MNITHIDYKGVDHLKDVMNHFSQSKQKIKIEVNFDKSAFSQKLISSHSPEFSGRVIFRCKQEIKSVFLSQLFLSITSSKVDESELVEVAVNNTKSKLKESFSRSGFVKKLLLNFNVGSSSLVDEAIEVVDKGLFSINLSDDSSRLIKLVPIRDIIHVSDLKKLELLELESIFSLGFSKDYYLTNKRIEATSLYQSYRVNSLKNIDIARDTYHLLNDSSEVSDILCHEIISKMHDINAKSHISSHINNEIRSLLDTCFAPRRSDFCGTKIDVNSLCIHLSKILGGTFTVTEFYGLYFNETNGLNYSIDEAPLASRSLVLLYFMVFLTLCDGDTVHIENLYMGLDSEKDKEELADFIAVAKKKGLHIYNYG